MRLQPRLQTLEVWRSVARFSSEGGQWNWGERDLRNSISDAEQLLCLMGPAGDVPNLESLEVLRYLGVPEVHLTVEPANVAAIQLYRQIGFSVRGLQANYFGAGEDRLIMVRRLAGSALPDVPRQCR